MKRTTAIANLKKVAAKVKDINGILCTPACAHRAVRISRVWAFGSTVKGKETPNDIDLLVEYKLVGPPVQRGGRWETNRGQLRKFGDYRMWSVKMSKECWFDKYYEVSLSAETEMVKFLKKGMKKVHVLPAETHNNFGDIAETKVLIYPRWEMTA